MHCVWLESKNVVIWSVVNISGGVFVKCMVFVFFKDTATTEIYTE